MIQFHRLVRTAVSRAMKPERRLEVFSKVVYILNADFPTQADGKPLHARWNDCERLHRQVAALLNSYEYFADDIGYPIMLCEIIERCAW
jgi:hypothetical protein